MSLPSPESEWYRDHEAVSTLIDYMAANAEFSKRDMAYAVEKPWKHTDLYEHALWAIHQEDFDAMREDEAERRMLRDSAAYYERIER